mgnify:CR=1 FL=1
MNVSVVIVSYNSMPYIEACVSSVYANLDLDLADFEMIIVDNYHEHDQRLYDLSTSYSNLKVIKSPKNGGFGYGNNIGVDQSSGDVILFLNPDTKFLEPVFSTIIDSFARYPEVGIIGCQQVNDLFKSTPSYAIHYEKWNILSVIMEKLFGRMWANKPRSDIFPWGSFMVVKRKDFIAAGCFDDGFFLDCEEADITRRLKPLKCLIAPLKIIHMVGATKTKSTKLDLMRQFLVSLKYYHKKHGFSLKKTKVNLSLIYLCRVVIFILTGQFDKANLYRKYVHLIWRAT